MSQSMTDPHVFLLGVNNAGKKLNLLNFSRNCQTRRWIGGIPQPIALFTIIESWPQHNVLLKNNSVNFCQKGSYMAGFGPTENRLDQPGC
jgi:hypothetical protein